ncbi:ABC transporter permease [Aeromonas sp. 102P]|uniref:ABC transporter permease n=1 Tax=Aeromonas sp. 102P TaxID=3452711 RepID=UPI003F7943E5
MRRPDVIRFAAVALLRQRSRALVLILAVSLSVTSVLLLTALGEGARRYVADQFSSLGKDLLVMFPGRKEHRRAAAGYRQQSAADHSR